MKKRILCSIVAVVLATCLMAVPAYRGWQTKIQPDGTTITIRQCGDEYYHYWLNESGQQVKQDEQGYWQVVGTAPTSQQVARRMAAKRSERQMMSPRKNYGDKQPSKLLVILVQFTDKSFKSQYNRTYFDNILNKEGGDGSHGCGSVKDYFNQSSDGRYVPTFDVIGPVTLDNNMAYYGANDADDNDVRPEYMVRDACNKADAAGCNFANYDTDGDGIVDNVYIIYAGYGEAGGGAANTIWPHSWDLKSAGITLRLDGKTIKHYACSPELSGGSGSNSDGIATFCHEFSHVIGMPDYYDTDYGTNYDNSATPGDWSLMDGGSYNGDGWYPPVYSIYDRYFMGWATPTILKDPENVTMPVGSQYARQITSDNVLAGPTKTSTVYYLENRQKTGFDSYNPGQGLLVWKVMYNSSSWNNNVLNNTAGTLRYTLLRADGKVKNIGQSTDALPAGGTGITPISGHAITGVALNTGVVTFLYNGGQQKMTVTFNGNEHGTPASGSLTETVVGGGVTLPSCTPVSGYTFLGWATTASAVAAQYTAGQNFKPANNCTLYAVYEHTGYVNLEYDLEGIAKTSGPAAGEILKSSGYSATFTAASGYDALTDDNCLYELLVNGLDKTNNYASLSAGVITITISAANITGPIVFTAIGTKTKGSNTFERVESMGELSAGDEVIFVNETGKVAAAGYVATKNGAYLDVEDITISNHTTELPDHTSVEVYTVGGTTGSWTFARSDKAKLGASDAKNISFTSGTNTWSISISTGTATVTNNGAGNGDLQYNDLNPRFTTYTTTQQSIQIYRRATFGPAVAPDFSFTQANVTMLAGETSTPQLPVTNSTGAITYSSNNTSVATVDVNTGAVTAIKQGGPVTITANIAATKRHLAAQATYTVTVNRASATINTVDNFTVKVGKTYTLDATTNSDAPITYTRADAKLTNVGNVFTGASAGNTSVTLRTAQTDKFTAAEKVINVTVQDVVTNTITWSDKGVTTPVVYEQGEPLALPAFTPTNCSATRTFQGWTASSTYSADVAPMYITLGGAVNANATYYAVFASSESGAVVPTTVNKDSYTETNGDVDANISYSSDKGNAATEPYITSNHYLRIYQNGGIFTLTAKNSMKITSVKIGSAQGTKVDVKVNGTSYATGQSIAEGGTYTVSDIDATSVQFTCKGTSKTQRLDINQLAVTYQGEAASQKYGYSLSCDEPAKADPTCSFAENKTMTVGDRLTQQVSTNSSGTVTYSTSDDEITVNTSTGEVTAVKAGSATVTASVAATARHNAANANYSITVNRATGTITASDMNLTVGQEESIGATTNTGATISYVSANTSIATVTSSGVVTAKAQGNTTITLSTAQNDTHTAANKVINVVVNAAAVAPSITFPDGNQNITYGTPLTKTATTNSDGVVSYSSSKTSVAEVDAQTGEITTTGVGDATITANVTATSNYTAASASYTLTVTKATNSIRFEHASETVQVGSFVTNSATAKCGVVVYSSADANTATVNSSTGQVKGVAAGSTTITATVTGTANYDGATESYTVTVTGAAGIDMQAHVASQEGRSAYSNYVTRQSSYYTGSYTYSTMMSQSGSTLFGTLNTLMGTKKQSGGTYNDLRDEYVNVDRDLNTPGNIIGFYDGRSMNGTWDSGTTWNREHTWPQSKGADSKTLMGSDMQSVRPASASVNSTRGNMAYGESNNYYNPDDEIAILNVNYKSSNRGTYRGDAARVILYDYVVYGEMGGHKNTYYNGNAQLLNKLGSSGVFENLTILLKWHMQDPPSLTEMVRNDGGEAYKGNRNPFIDYPELAILMLKDCQGLTTYTVTNSTSGTMSPNYTYTTSGGFITYLYNQDGTTHPSEVNVSGGTLASYSASTGLLEVTNVTGSVVITASGETPVTTYTITAVPNNESYGSVTGGGTYNENAVISLTATPKSGYVFSQWQDGSHINPRSVTVTENAIYTATFVAEGDPEEVGDITVTWVLNGETFATQHYFTGDALVVPSPAPADGGTVAKPKYFIGWSTEANWFSVLNKVPSDLFTTGGQIVTKDMTYYAIYSPVK